VFLFDNLFILHGILKHFRAAEIGMSL
jgi:hypothetical protein